ncbi:MAG TPA: nucleotidyl transferase AbiEii/AbiGii toxin family protein [Thermoanaerobaculia bacterium]|nr:nucleotidyl transferase AbiEii/AbiGii toxin family protein [Thermoanaerobaculia bacterium]
MPLTLDHPESLAVASRAALARLATLSWMEDFYLAGSAALALYTGHRPIQELDLMAGTERLASASRRDRLADLLGLDPATTVETARDGYLFVRFGPVAVRFHYYPYPLIAPPEELAGVAVAAAEDLGLMKLGAIISRGTLRDFVDLYLLCRRLPLAELLATAGEKFGHVRDFPLQALKGLADWSATAGEPMPRLASPLERREVETWARSAVRELAPFTVAAGETIA